MDANPMPPRVRKVLTIAAEDNGVTVAAILGPARLKHVVAARTQSCQILRRMGFTLPEIGRLLGLHHSSVHYAIHKPEIVGDFAQPKPAVVEIPFPDLSGEWAI